MYEQLLEAATALQVGGCVNEAFNTTPQPYTSTKKGTQTDYFFTGDKGEEYRIQFFGAGGSWGKKVDTVFIGKRRGTGKVYADNIDKIASPNKVIATFIAIFTDYTTNDARGALKDGFAVSLSGKAAKRFAPVLKKVINRTMRGRLGLVKGSQPDPKREYVWVYRANRNPEQVFDGKKITGDFSFGPVNNSSSKSTSAVSANKPSASEMKDARAMQRATTKEKFSVNGDVSNLPSDIHLDEDTVGKVTDILKNALGAGWDVSLYHGYGERFDSSIRYTGYSHPSGVAIEREFDKWTKTNSKFLSIKKWFLNITNGGSVHLVPRGVKVRGGEEYNGYADLSLISKPKPRAAKTVVPQPVAKPEGQKDFRGQSDFVVVNSPGGIRQRYSELDVRNLIQQVEKGKKLGAIRDDLANLIYSSNLGAASRAAREARAQQILMSLANGGTVDIRFGDDETEDDYELDVKPVRKSGGGVPLKRKKFSDTVKAGAPTIAKLSEDEVYKLMQEFKEEGGGDFEEDDFEESEFYDFVINKLGVDVWETDF